MDAPDLHSSEDYREFLRLTYGHRRASQPSFSYRFMARRLGVDAGQLAHILQGRLHLPPRAVSAAAELCRLSPGQAAYFEELVRLARARTSEEKARCRERLSALREVAPQAVPGASAGFYGKWHHAVVRALSGMREVAGSGEELGRCCEPGIGPDEARDSVALLEELGLCGRSPEGRLVPIAAHVVPADDIPREVLREWHRQNLTLSTRSLDAFPPGERDISTLTVALGAAERSQVQEWLREFRKQVQALAAATSSPDRVVQVCLQLVPVSVPCRRKA